ncbi:hypothetical protein G5V57_00115 [Nordella sp. HKS 07]|uniref:hypothetical protein n=1 Tax=Nordella sp. HKS 07 TaxID=2712222 RepID=UPI0013E1AC88|nr:hypothetical protein [Nordella sp. HKS 07]QIG46302.1 hypothetical protein G5V57_00115 [Nordella sp. HKS 07]
MASVVDNSLIGIVGNSLVMPVALGNHLDPQFRLASGATLLEQYDPQSPAPPSRISLPTRGVFAEAVMGDCNACEEIDDTRFWRWDEAPIDEPPPLDVNALASRRSEPAYGAATPFPTPIIGMQTPQAAPDPAGVKAALDALARSSFTDITGLAGTQANALAAYSKAMDTALAFGKEASDLAKQAAATRNVGQTMRAIDKAEADNKIEKSDAKQLRTSALKTMAGDAAIDSKALSVADRLKVIDGQEARGGIAADQAAKQRVEVMSALNPEEMRRVQESEAVTDLMRTIPGESVSSVEIGETKIRTAPDRADAELDGAAQLNRLERQFAEKYRDGFIVRIPGLWGDAVSYALWNFAVNSSDIRRFDVALGLQTIDPFWTTWRDQGIYVDIVGHASASGTEAHNQNVAFARALAVSNVYERRFGMPSSRLNIRQEGISISRAPESVQRLFDDEDREALDRAWNRRVELFPVVPLWTDQTFDRIVNYLSSPAAPVRTELERATAIQLAQLLKDDGTDDRFLNDFDYVRNDIRDYWAASPLYRKWLQEESGWERFRFLRHMRQELSQAAKADAADSALAMYLLGALRQMQNAIDALNNFIMRESGGSADAIQVVYLDLLNWLNNQLENDRSVYSVLR